jgi:hypothetical protein
LLRRGGGGPTSRGKMTVGTIGSEMLKAGAAII